MIRHGLAGRACSLCQARYGEYRGVLLGVGSIVGAVESERAERLELALDEVEPARVGGQEDELDIVLVRPGAELGLTVGAPVVENDDEVLAEASAEDLEQLLGFKPRLMVPGPLGRSATVLRPQIPPTGWGVVVLAADATKPPGPCASASPMAVLAIAKSHLRSPGRTLRAGSGQTRRSRQSPNCSMARWASNTLDCKGRSCPSRANAWARTPDGQKVTASSWSSGTSRWSSRTNAAFDQSRHSSARPVRR